MGDQVFLNVVISATMNPPINPPNIQGIAASGASECDMPQVHAAVATAHSSRKPVLLTVPCKVIASPVATTSRNAFSLRTGLEVRNGLAMMETLRSRKLSTRHCSDLNSTPRGRSLPFDHSTLQTCEAGFVCPAICRCTYSLNCKGCAICG